MCLRAWGGGGEKVLVNQSHWAAEFLGRSHKRRDVRSLLHGGEGDPPGGVWKAEVEHHESAGSRSQSQEERGTWSGATIKTRGKGGGGGR